jgi:hypothetical protein
MMRRREQRPAAFCEIGFDPWRGSSQRLLSYITSAAEISGTTRLST